MKKSLVKQFEEQFGKEWVCTCSAPFEPKSLEIISENKNSLIAHYICPNCQKEQMLAAAVRQAEKQEDPMIRLPRTIISADDVLDIKTEVRAMRMSTIRSLDRRSTLTRRGSVEASNWILPPEAPANNSLK
jgi:hypothetical protein